MNMPKISVVIPTHNRASFLKKAIESVLRQSYTNLEVIIVDDNSTDNTKEVVNSYKDKRIKYIVHDKNKGGAVARNTGIIASTGDIVAFLDDDDEWLPEKIKKQMELFESKPFVDLIYTAFYLIDSITPSVASFALLLASSRLSPHVFINSLKSTFVEIPGVSTISIKRDEFPFSTLTFFFHLALRVSCGTSDTLPIISPVQSLKIRFASVVLPTFGGP